MISTNAASPGWLALGAAVFCWFTLSCSPVSTDGEAGSSGGTAGAGGMTGTGAGSAVGGLPNTSGGSGSGGGSTTDPSVWINSKGKVESGSNSFGIEGYWYAFGDGETTTASGNPWSDGKYCVTGTSTATEGNWGAGIGIDLNGLASEKMPYAYEGK